MTVNHRVAGSNPARGAKKIIMEEIVTKTPHQPVGWLEVKLANLEVETLYSYIEYAGKNPISRNATLAGNISSSLDLIDTNDWFFNTVIIPLIEEYQTRFPEYARRVGVLTEDAPFYMNSFWVNFQKENEFNPIHNHAGVFSFTIWIKIPTNWREQHKIPISANSNSPGASNFEFSYTDMLGAITQNTFLLDKAAEGRMLFFPSGLMHNVYPFYNCSETRISISGNVSFNISENIMKQYRAHNRD